MSEPHAMDLTGKLIIKMQLGEDIRRIQMINDDLTYDELFIMMQRVFKGQLDTSDEVSVKYKDEDGDLITISDSTDLTFAIQCSRILRLVLFVNGKPHPLEGDDVKHIRAELQTIRNHVNALLDTLEPPVPAGAALQNGELDTDVAMATASPAPNKLVAPSNSVPAAQPLGDSKEFDPLSQQQQQGGPPPAQRPADDPQNKVMSAFGISNEVEDFPPPPPPPQRKSQIIEPWRSDSAPSQRPPSPTGSTSSIGSSASNRAQQPNALPGQPPQQQFQQPQQPGYPGYQQQQQQQRQMHPGQPPYQQQQQPGYPAASGADAASSQPSQYQQYSAPGQQAGAPGQPGPPGPGGFPAASQYGAGQYQQQYNPSSVSGGMPQGYGGYQQPAHPAGPPAAAPGGSANPYSRGSPYGGAYPRAQGQYPQQAYPQNQPPQ